MILRKFYSYLHLLCDNDDQLVGNIANVFMNAIFQLLGDGVGEKCFC